MIQVPAFGLSADVADENQIEVRAKALIGLCGGAPATFDVDVEVDPGGVIVRRGAAPASDRSVIADKRV